MSVLPKCADLLCLARFGQSAEYLRFCHNAGVIEACRILCSNAVSPEPGSCGPSPRQGKTYARLPHPP